MIKQLLILSIFITINLGAQEMNTPQEAVIDLFVYTDQKEWDGLSKVFTENVNLDYSSFTGNSAALISSKDIIKSWSEFMPIFTNTHHQIGNIKVQEDGSEASVFCYGIASHYLQSENGSVWIVVGTYDFKLERVDKTWKVNSMTFNFKYQDGNLDLIQEAKNNNK